MLDVVNQNLALSIDDHNQLRTGELEGDFFATHTEYLEVDLIDDLWDQSQLAVGVESALWIKVAAEILFVYNLRRRCVSVRNAIPCGASLDL